MKSTTNVFLGGLRTDYHPLTQDLKGLTDALNATLITYNGNEMMLLNDMGNSRILDSTTGNIMGLRDGFIPLGMKEHGGILYIASFNPTTNEGLLGTIPSPVFNYKYIKTPLITTYERYPYLCGKTQYSVKDGADLTHPINKYQLYREGPFKISDARFLVADQFMISLYIPEIYDKTIRKNCWIDSSDLRINIPFPMISQNVRTASRNVDTNSFEYSGPGWISMQLQALTEKSKHTVVLDTVSNKSTLFYYPNNHPINLKPCLSNYWFLELHDLTSPIYLDTERNLAVYYYQPYPNIEPGYLYTKVEPELPYDIDLKSGESNNPILCMIFDVENFEFESDDPIEPGSTTEPPPGDIEDEEIPEDPNLPEPDPEPDPEPELPDTPVEKKRIVNPFVLPYNDISFDEEALKEMARSTAYARLRSPYKLYNTMSAEEANENGELLTSLMTTDGKLLSEDFFYFAMSDTMMSEVIITNNTGLDITNTENGIVIKKGEIYYTYNYFLITDLTYTTFEAESDVVEFLKDRYHTAFNNDSIQIDVSFISTYEMRDAPYFNTNDPYSLSSYVVDELFILVKKSAGSAPSSETDETIEYDGEYYTIKRIVNDVQKSTFEDSTGQFQLKSLDIDRFHSIFFQTRPCSLNTISELSKDLNKSIMDNGSLHYQFDSTGGKQGALPWMHEKVIAQRTFKYLGLNYTDFYLVVFPHTYSLIDPSKKVSTYTSQTSEYNYVNYYSVPLSTSEISNAYKNWFYHGDYMDPLYPPYDDSVSSVTLSAPRKAPSATNSIYGEDPSNFTTGGGLWAKANANVDYDNDDEITKVTIPHGIASPILQAFEQVKYDLSNNSILLQYNASTWSDLTIPGCYYINNDGTKVTGNEHYSIAESCVVLPLRLHYKTVNISTHSELIESVNNSWYMSYPELTYDSLSIVQLGSTTESDKKYFDLKIDSKNIITCDAALVGFKKCEDDTKLDVNEYVGNINCFVQATLGSTAGYRYSVGCLLTHPKTTKDDQTVINYDEGNFIFDKRIGVLTEYNSESDQYTLISMDENVLNEQFPGFLYRFGPTVTSYLTVEGSNLICLDPSKDSLGLLDEYTSEEVKTTLQTQKSNLNTLYNTTISALESAITEEDKIKATSAYCGALIRYLKLLSYNISTCVKVIDITAAASILELGGWTDEKTVEGVIDFYQDGRFNELNSDILERVFDEYPDGSYAYLSSFEITPRFRHWVEYLNGND